MTVINVISIGAIRLLSFFHINRIAIAALVELLVEWLCMQRILKLTCLGKVTPFHLQHLSATLTW